MHKGLQPVWRRILIEILSDSDTNHDVSVFQRDRLNQVANVVFEILRFIEKPEPAVAKK